MMTKLKKGGRQAGLVAVLLVMVIGLPLAIPNMAHSNSYPIVSPYAELSAAWWQWALTEPAATNPMLHSDADAALTDHTPR